MALAETARLLASYEFQNKGSAGINQAVGQLGKLESASTGLGRGSSILQQGFGLIGKGAGAVGNAFNTLKSRIGSLLSGPLGMLGLGAGLLSLGGLFKSGIDQATEFGSTVSKLTSLTGLSAEQTSRLAAAFEHFGLSGDTVIRIAGMAEKNLGNLTKTTTSARASTDQLRTAQERLRVAQLHLSEVESQRGAKLSTIVAAQNRVADAQRRLSELTAKGGITVNGAAKFLKDYGFALTDASGRIKNFNQLILTAADYFNNPLIPAQTKAAALAKLFGRNWIELIPILKAGSAGITAAADEAQRLGLTLTKDNITALAKLKTATRDFGTALGGLKLQLGLAVVPLLTQLATGATKFLSTADTFGKTGSQKIVGFFKDVVAWGERAFGFIEHNIVPGIKAAIDNWNRLPAPLRSLLFKGFAANQTVSFLLGFNPLSVGASIGGAIAGKVAGILAGGLISKLGTFFGGLFGKVAVEKGIPQLVAAVQPIPVFVTNPGFGVPGGGTPTAPVPGVPGGPTGKLPPLAFWGLALTDLGLLVSLSGSNRPASAAENKTNETLQKIQEQGHYSPQQQAIADQLKIVSGKLAQAHGEEYDALLKQQATLEAQLIALGTVSTTIRTTAASSAAAQRLYNLPKGDRAKAREAGALPTPKPITAAEFERILKTTPFIGTAQYKSIFEAFTTARPARGGDPFGQNFLHLVSTLKDPKAAAVQYEIAGHLKELRNLEAYYIAHGDLASAKRTQDTINAIDRLIGVTKADDAASRAANVAAHRATTAAIVRHAAITDQGSRRVANILGTVKAATDRAQNAISVGAQRTAAHLSRLEGLGAATATNTGISARKKSLISVTVPITTYASFSVNALGNQLTHIDETVSSQYGGKVIPLG